MAAESAKIWEFKDCRLEGGPEGCLWRGRKLLHLQPKALELLKVLVNSHDRVISRKELIESVWPDTFVEEGNLTFSISSLRKSLKEEFGDDVVFVETVPKIGYRFAQRVREVREKEPDHGIVEEEGSETVPDSRRYYFLVSLICALLFTSFGMWWSLDRADGISTVSIKDREFNSLAVFPARSLSDEDSDELLGIAIADSLVSRLGRLNRFSIRPISSVIRFDSKAIDELEQSKYLSVDLILTGTYLCRNGKVRFSFRLLDTRDGALVWNKSFEVEDAELSVLQDRVSAVLTNDFVESFGENTKAIKPFASTESSEAYLLYLRGKYLLKLRKSSDEKPIDLFRKAVELDPAFAAAYVGIADSLAFLEPPQQGIDEAIETALELDPSSSEAWATRGFVRMFHHWDWAEAKRSLQKAVELEPYNSKARHWLGVYHSLTGNFESARKEMLIAQDLDPGSNFIRLDLAQLLYFERDFGAAEDAVTRFVELEGENERAHLLFSEILYMKGDHFKSAQHLIESVRSNKAHLEGAKGALNSKGHRGFLEFRYNFLNCDRFGVIPSMECPRISAMLGKEERALKYLETAVQRRVFLLPFIAIDPFWDRFRGNRRFDSVVSKIGIPG